MERPLARHGDVQIASVVSHPAVRAYVHPTSSDFREYGASGLMFFLYVPALVAILVPLFRRRILADLAIPIFVVTVFALYFENDDGYPDEQIAAAWMRSHGYAGNVYVISNNAFDYYFRRNGVLSIGNWTGPAGWFRLLQAIDAGEAAEFLNGLGTRAVFLSPQQLIDAGIEHVLVEQLESAGYREVPLTPRSGYHLYVRG